MATMTVHKLLLILLWFSIADYAKPDDASLVSIDYRQLERFAADSGIIDGVSDGSCDGSIEQACASGDTASLIDDISRAFGSDGLGIVEISNIPQGMIDLKSKLLPMARSLANLSPQELDSITLPETMYSIGWSYGKEQLKSGKYDFAKGSFYANIFDGDRPDSNETINVYPSSLQPFLEQSMDEMNRFMGNVGLWIANLCDEYMIKQGSGSGANDGSIRSIYDSLKTCYNCKARLLHYFPIETADETQSQDEWCGWHTDHGSLTALLPGMYLDANGETIDCASSDSAPCASNESGLHIQKSSGEVVRIHLAESSLGFQIGETASIMTDGSLRATPHAVKANYKGAISRESMALFLQPEPNERLPQLSKALQEGSEPNDPMSLGARWKSTFGEFQIATLTAYN